MIPDRRPSPNGYRYFKAEGEALQRIQQHETAVDAFVETVQSLIQDYGAYRAQVVHDLTLGPRSRHFAVEGLLFDGDPPHGWMQNNDSGQGPFWEIATKPVGNSWGARAIRTRIDDALLSSDFSPVPKGTDEPTDQDIIATLSAEEQAKLKEPGGDGIFPGREQAAIWETIISHRVRPAEYIKAGDGFLIRAPLSAGGLARAPSDSPELSEDSAKALLTAAGLDAEAEMARPDWDCPQQLFGPSFRTDDPRLKAQEQAHENKAGLNHHQKPLKTAVEGFVGGFTLKP